MFTGIIENLGVVENITHQQEQARLVIRTEAAFSGCEPGESIAVNGVCLTVVEPREGSFAVDLSAETLRRTSFHQLRAGDPVNLERSLTANKKMSGHFVQGHVDAVGRILSLDPRPGEVLIRFEHPPELAPYFIEKGSVAVDGISLTVFDCRDNAFTVSIIPFTWQHTNLNARKSGDPVNLECDMIGKYVVKTLETLLRGGAKEGITLDFLKQHGWS